MSQKRELIYKALLVELRAALAPREVLRDDTEAQDPAKPYIVLFSGSQPEEVSRTIGDPSFEWVEEASLEFYAQNVQSEDRDQLIADLSNTVVTAVHGKTLGGLAQSVQVTPAIITHQGIEGAEDISSAALPILLYYETSSPIG
jgi:hypothetical protein